MTRPRLHVSKDGSHTLWSERFDQYYHNPNGAIAESRHVFIETPNLAERVQRKERFQVLEIGFGTGLNLLVLMETIQQLPNTPEVHYDSVEMDPISTKCAKQLNYPQELDLPGSGDILPQIFTKVEPGLNTFRLQETTELRLFTGTFARMPPPVHKVDAIFFDPFSPDVNPELWTPEVFRKLADWSDDEGILTTYGAASAARAAMAAGGWELARAPGALGKREMTVAALNPHLLESLNLKRINGQRLAERFYGSGDSDRQ